MTQANSNLPLDLNNGELAFRHLSNKQLTRAYWLFKVIGQPTMVSLGPSMTDLALKFRLPIKSLIKQTIFAQFCGGETIAESLKRVDELAVNKVGTILDVAKEGEGREADYNAVEAEVIRTIEEAAQHPWIPFAVFKPTGVGSAEILSKKEKGERLSESEEAAFERCKKRIDNICSYAAHKNVRIMVDAEESWFQNTVDALVREQMLKYNRMRAIVFNTVQLYRHDRLEFLKACHEDALKEGYYLGVKLVRGAYMEKERREAMKKSEPSPINPNKDATDKLYNDALRYSIEHIDRIAICAGTHNDQSVLLLCRLMEEKGLAHDDQRIHFAQLLGMSDHISYNLAAEGYNVAKYVPYGPVEEMLPYLTRRAQENSSVLGQSSRELSMLSRELKRRGLKSS